MVIMQEALSKTEQCLNCGEILQGRFCSHCGQERTNPIVSLGEYIKDILDEFITWDSKALRSILPLLFKPGFLTNEYLAGRRVSYLLPSRLYVIISVAFFLLVNRFDPVTVEAMGMGNAGDARLTERINSAVADLLPSFMFGVIPAFALGLKCVYFTSRLYYTHHLAFAFHFFSFVFIGWVLPVLTRSDTLWNLSFLVIPVYLFFALKCVYRQSPAKTLVKSVLLYIGFWALITIYLLVVFIIASLQTRT